MKTSTITKTMIAGLLAAGLAACNSGGSVPTPGQGNGTYPQPGQTYIQTELLSRPAVKEAFENFQSHDTTNRIEPYNDPTLQGDIGTFTTGVAGRSAAWASALQSILYPNEMVADLSQGGPASYLGVETGGATGGTFGGRGLNDDTIAISLGAIFGNTLSALNVVPDDNKESPCLSNDNVPNDKANTNTFPYVQAPI